MCFIDTEDDQDEGDLTRRCTVPDGRKRRKVSQDVEEFVEVPHPLATVGTYDDPGRA